MNSVLPSDFLLSSRLTVLLTALALCLGSVASVGAPAEYDLDSAGFRIVSPAASSDFARPLAVGDFNGDGCDDIVIGQSDAPDYANVYIIRGQRGPWVASPQTIDLATVSASKQFRGSDQTINLPTALAVGDLNGDGIDDLAMPAPIMSPLGRTHAGVVYVALGSLSFFDSPAVVDLTSPGAMQVVTFQGAVEGGDLGSQSAFSGMDAKGLAIGDLNGDGIGDLVVGAHLVSPSGRSQAGQVYVVFGSASMTGGQSYDLAAANVRFDGARNYYETGTYLEVADITGDGIGDLIIACDIAGEQTFYLSSEGIVYVFKGRTSWPGSFDLRTATPDLKILGRRDGDGLGTSVAMADLNRDGTPDLCLGATGAGSAPAQADDYGAMAVFFGGSHLGTLPRVINMAVTAPNVEWTGSEAYCNLGWAAAAGDFDGSGHVSLAASAVFADYPGQSTNGFIEVLLSRASWSSGALVRCAAGEHDYRVVGPPQGRYGFALAAGDTNGDGIDELVVGAPFIGDGEVHVYQLVVPTSADTQTWTLYE